MAAVGFSFPTIDARSSPIFQINGIDSANPNKTNTAAKRFAPARRDVTARCSKIEREITELFILDHTIFYITRTPLKRIRAWLVHPCIR